MCRQNVYIFFWLVWFGLLKTYVDSKSCRLRLPCCLRLEHICWNIVIGVAHIESRLFLQSSEPVTKYKSMRFELVVGFFLYILQMRKML